MSEPAVRSHYVPTLGVQTHYVKSGESGPPLVLCHGGAPGFSGEVSFGPILPVLGEKFRAYAPDGVGGFGDTDPSFPAREGAASRVEQLHAFLDALGLGQVFLAGNSQGAWVAARYAADYPERVRALFLIASGTVASAMGLRHEGTEGLRALRAYDGTRQAMRTLLETLIWNREKISDALVERFQTTAARPGAAAARRIFLEGMGRLTQEAGWRTRFDLRPTLPRSPIPITFLWGEEDRFAPVALGRQLELLLPHASFEYVPCAGHLVHIDQPEQVGRRMIEFFVG